MPSPETAPEADRISLCYRFGTAEYDEARRELRVAGLPVELEPRVMDLLAYLLRHAGELVTKEELLREVWAGRITIEKVLPNAIAKLRRALGADNAERIITQARVGYRLDGPIQRSSSGRHAESAPALAPGATLPQRPHYRLQRCLSSHRGSEVWLAEHHRGGEPRVFKFALDADRLRALKRETTLLRVLHEGAHDASGFVVLLDWNFETAPYFVELEYGGQNLLEWATEHLQGLERSARLSLFLGIAAALEAAHALGVLHKDLKPANILVRSRPEGPEVRLTDFGSGRMLDPERLQELGITSQGLTRTAELGEDSNSGTPLYLAPELHSGQMPTLRSDVYALGVLLFQLLTGRLREPMAPGWEADIDDPLLQEDLRLATDRDPARRFASVALLSARLRQLPERRDAAAREAELARERQRRDLALARSQARRPYVIALIGLLGASLIGALLLGHRAEQARVRAESELARAEAIRQFVEEDLISRANPLILGKGADAPLRDVLLAARDRLDARLSAQPQTAAALHLSLAGLFNTLDLWSEAEAAASRALALHGTMLDAQGTDAHLARAIRVRVLSRLSRFDEAKALLDELADAGTTDASAAALHALAASTFHLARGAYGDAVPELERALATAVGPLQSQVQRDSLVIDLIAAQGLSGQAEQAVREYTRFAAALEARPGDTTLLLALAQLSAARSVSLGGDHARAEAMLLAAREVIRTQLGPEHSRLLGLLNELMAVYFRQGEWTRVIPIAEDLHQRLRQKLGEGHNATWVSLGNLGRAHYEAGDAAAASPILREAHQRLIAVVGADNPQAQDVGFLLASAELTQGRSAAALLPTLDATALEKTRATGLWAHALGLLQGLQAAVDGDRQQAGRLLRTHLEAVRADPPSRGSRLFHEAETLLQTLDPVAAD
ncbi:MAG: winged helix-turn-helix domain-containing protein [Xanthomonadales bacterium]|nr:winged helix-turn-helix domain-containing protein [Xanthomonadales bacterium]